MFDFASIIVNIPIVLFSLTVHECAHGWVSTKLGDPTPRYEKRLTLNPLAHLDPIGTLLMIFTGFGWAKPVSVNPRYYKNPKRGMAITAAAGPLSNFLLAVIGTIIYGLVFLISGLTSTQTMLTSLLYVVLRTFISLNVGLMVFNLIPIPPMDGSKILGIFLPDRTYYKVLQYERYCMILVMILSLSGALGYIIGFGRDIILNLLIKVVLVPMAALMEILM